MKIFPSDDLDDEKTLLCGECDTWLPSEVVTDKGRMGYCTVEDKPLKRTHVCELQDHLRGNRLLPTPEGLYWRGRIDP